MERGFNRLSADWIILKRWNEEQIAKAQEELESFSVSPSRADQLRGIIFILREQIEKAEPTPRPQVETTNYG
ncbi:MAG TPA: hypothetical protein VD768_06235 [Sphingomicrobium sp.]|nr:hypothetical protein [Sphingomicrobium sp.]